MGLSNKQVGPKLFAKIQIYILIRAELLFKLCSKIPCILESFYTAQYKSTLEYLGKPITVFLSNYSECGFWVPSGSGINSDVSKISKNQKIIIKGHKIKTDRTIRTKYGPKEPQNWAEFERFSLTSPSGQTFSRKIGKKFENLIYFLINYLFL